MRGGYRIARLFGVNIFIDPSWLFIFVLVTWNLSVVFGQFHPEWAVPLRWGLALGASLLFFVSVLAHELAHALVAKAQGTPVRRITLFLFGGAADIQREPESPGREFIMALLGPLTSIVIGVALTVAVGLMAGPFVGPISAPAQLIAQMGPVATLAMWLGSVNILLGVFNLVPGFPLDGGRILRSILWAITGSYRRATRYATWAGQLIAWAMIAGGVAMIFGVTLPVFGTGFISGLWLALIGWFLSNAAVQSYRRVVIDDLLEDIPVSQLMRREPPVVPSNITVHELVHEYVMGTDDHAFPVVDDGCLEGLVTLEDIRNQQRSDWTGIRVREIMTPTKDLITVAPNDDAAESFERLMQRDVNQLPVLQDCALVGMLRRRDIVRYLQVQAREGTEEEVGGL